MSSKVKPKIYGVWLNNRKPEEGGPDLLIRAQTKQGAISHAAAQTITCEYADQNLLYAATKAGVTRIDVAADPAQNILPEIEPVAGASA
jgi:hypothetical protein